MNKILVCKHDEDLMLTKSKGLNITTIDFTELSCGDTFSVKEENNKYIGVTESETDDNPIFSVVTNEFGLYAQSKGVKAKIKVSFCDGGMLIIDVLEGGILIKPEDEVLLVSRNMDNVPEVNLDSICWVTADTLLSFKQYWGKYKSLYNQSFEFVFEVSGELKYDELRSLNIRLISDEVVDISGGAIAVIEARDKKKEEARKVVKGYNTYLNAVNSSSNFEFEDDEDIDTDEYIEDDDDFDEDGSSY